jgi:hypothetical protein
VAVRVTAVARGLIMVDRFGKHISSRPTGYLRIFAEILGAVTIFVAFSQMLWVPWSTGETTFLSIGGYLPWSDASWWFKGGLRLLLDGKLVGFNATRIVNELFFCRATRHFRPTFANCPDCADDLGRSRDISIRARGCLQIGYRAGGRHHHRHGCLHLHTHKNYDDGADCVSLRCLGSNPPACRN